MAIALASRPSTESCSARRRRRRATNTTGRGRRGDGKSGATPIDYLEKIFQIPYWVPRMTAKTSGKLIEDLVAADRAARPTEPSSRRGPRSSGAPVVPIPKSVGPPEDEQPPNPWRPASALGLTADEIDALTVLSPYLGGSPRRARRFVNVYRVAKASLPPADITLLEEGECRPLATQLAIATGAPNAFGKWVQASAAGQPVDVLLGGLTIDADERATSRARSRRSGGCQARGADVGTGPSNGGARPRASAFVHAPWRSWWRARVNAFSAYRSRTISSTTTSGSGRSVHGSHPRDVMCQTRTRIGSNLYF